MNVSIQETKKPKSSRGVHLAHKIRLRLRNREFARRGMHIYEHDFDPFLGFLFVWRGILLINFIARFKISPEFVF